MNTKRIQYYSNLICQKITTHVDAFMDRVDALSNHDKEKAEFIEKMILDPLDKQISYLCNKLLTILNKGQI